MNGEDSELKFEMIGGKGIGDELIFTTAVRYKIGESWLTLCYVDDEGRITWLDTEKYEIQD